MPTASSIFQWSSGGMLSAILAVPMLELFWMTCCSVSSSLLRCASRMMSGPIFMKPSRESKSDDGE